MRGIGNELLFHGWNQQAHLIDHGVRKEWGLSGHESGRRPEHQDRRPDAAKTGCDVLASETLHEAGYGRNLRCLTAVLQFLWSLWIGQCGVFLRENAT